MNVFVKLNGEGCNPEFHRLVVLVVECWVDPEFQVQITRSFGAMLVVAGLNWKFSMLTLASAANPADVKYKSEMAIRSVLNVFFMTCE